LGDKNEGRARKSERDSFLLGGGIRRPSRYLKKGKQERGITTVAPSDASVQQEPKKPDEVGNDRVHDANPSPNAGREKNQRKEKKVRCKYRHKTRDRRGAPKEALTPNTSSN